MLPSQIAEENCGGFFFEGGCVCGGREEMLRFRQMLQVQSQDHCRGFCNLHCRQGDAMIITIHSEFKLC